MAKTTAPLLSFDARGAIANAQVYSSWRGIQYARRYVVPSNPNTVGQQSTRNTFGWLNKVWSYLPGEAIEGWDAQAYGQPFVGRNGFIKSNLPDLRGESDLANFVFSPSARSGPIAAGMALTAGSTQITVALTAPSLPTDWTIDSAIAAAISDQSPATGTAYDVTSGSDATDPYEVVLTGLTASQLYYVGGWFKYLRSDGRYAYGRALMDSETPTA